MANVSARMTFEGDAQLKKLLTELPGKVVRRGLWKAINAASTPLQKAVAKLAHVHDESGTLAKSIAKKTKTYAKDDRVIAIVGARKDAAGSWKGKKRVPSKYLHLVTLGTRPHSLGKGARLARKGKAAVLVGGNQHPGFKGDNFIAAAFEQTKGRMQEIVAEKLGPAIEQEAAKLAKG